jgi:hypothetical protein
VHYGFGRFTFTTPLKNKWWNSNADHLFAAGRVDHDPLVRTRYPRQSEK